MILACQNINKAFGTNVILKDASFHIEEKEKAAIVGINGAGKSTLLKIIMKQIPADSGEVILAKDRTIGYLAQHEAVSSGNTIYEELLEVKQDIFELERHIRTLELQMKSQSGGELEQTLELYNRLNTEFEQKNGYACKSEIVGVLKGLGFTEDEFSKQVDTLSGGQKTRVALGKLLLAKPDLILLDEPTNHLDMQSIAWLENFLINYSGAVIIVAHDRYFLNRVVSKVIEIDHAKATTFLGNYSAYSEKKAQLRDSQLKAWMNQQREIKHQQEVIDKLKSFNREKSIKRAESREKMLEKMEVLDRPDTEVQELKLSLEPRFPSGNDDRFYPSISGVARSLNYYPIGDETAEEGTVSLALGLGKYIVDGGLTLRICPYHPNQVLQTSEMEIALRETQTRFYALDLKNTGHNFSLDDGFNLLKLPVKEADNDGARPSRQSGTVRWRCS